MRREDQLLKTLPVLKQCLEHCERSPVPMKSLRYFCEGLRSNPAWSEPEVRDLECTAHRAMRAMLARADAHRQAS